MSTDILPTLSIIIPILNESGELPELFATLECQRGIGLEVILCDGGSSTESEQLTGQLTQNFRHQVRYIRTARGRGRQMNAGADIAQCDILLFLHADSRFTDHEALSTAVHVLREQQSQGAGSVATRFELCFRRTNLDHPLAYAFYESKARLNRADCIRGDQGFMLMRSFFQQLGGFDESLPFLEDVRLAFSIARQATWTLLPASISTSARRFETEGFCERQVLNAIIANAEHQNWSEFFHDLPGIYRCSTETGKLLLHPLLNGIRTLIAGHDFIWQRRFWLATGQYVAGNIWQLFFWLDVRRAFRERRLGPETPDRWTKRYTRFLEPYSHNLLLSATTALAVWIWFRLLLFYSRRKMHHFKKTSQKY